MSELTEAVSVASRQQGQTTVQCRAFPHRRRRLSLPRILASAQARPSETATTQAAAVKEVQASKISLGTMFYGTQHSLEESLALMDFAFENGVTLFDTAEMYPVPSSAQTYGQSEIQLGTWMKQHPRDRVLVSTKVAGPSGMMTWIRDGDHCLDRDYVDYYYLHWPDRYAPAFGETDYDPTFAFEYIPFEEQYEALKDCVVEGKVRYIGVSNETPFGLMKFCQLTKRDAALPKIHCLQNSYHLLNRTFDAGLAECCHEEGVRLFVYSPLAQGLLTGKYLNGGPKEARFNYYDRHTFPGIHTRYRDRPNIDEALAEYASIAASAEISLTEMSLRFVMHHPLVESAITGATTREQLRELVVSMHKPPLEEDVFQSINAVHSRYPNPVP